MELREHSEALLYYCQEYSSLAVVKFMALCKQLLLKGRWDAFFGQVTHL